MKVRFHFVLLIAILFLSILTAIPHTTAYPYNKTDTEVSLALDWLKSQQNTSGMIDSFEISSWAVMAIAASEDDPKNWTKNGDSIVQYLKNNVNTQSSCTDYSRFILSMTAAGEDPRNIDGVDLVANLESCYNETEGQFGDSSLLNDDYWAVMALISAGVQKNDSKLQSAVNFIKNNQDASGGWAWDVAYSWGPDVDSTSAAIMALISADEPQNSASITTGLAYIKSTQDSSGGFNSGFGTSAETNSWAIQAIIAAGQDPTSINWLMNNSSPIQNLLTFQNPNGSFNDYQPAPSVWTTSYAIPALLGKPYPIVIMVENKTIPSFGDISITFDISPDNTGKIIFDGSEYGDNSVTSRNAGTYSIIANPSSNNSFSRWMGFGQVSIDDTYSASTNCTVNGNCTIRLLTSGSPSTQRPSGCIIATATYGSEMESEVLYMRHVRDNMIGSNQVGTLLVSAWNDFYYLWSPPIAHFIANHNMLKPVFRILLLPLLGTIHLSAFIYGMSVGLNSTIASLMTFLFAAVFSIMAYVVTPLLVLNYMFRKSSLVKKKSISWYQ
ncbi:prenyltransferase/squalene oxidase repeat-containing protein [[Eubacterium] cellulosolvens]